MRKILYFLFFMAGSVHFASANNHEQNASQQDIKPKDQIIVVSDGFDTFVNDINNFGKKGYKLIFSKSSDSNGLSRAVAGIMQYQKDSTFSYEWLVSQNRNLLESQIEKKAKDGFRYSNSFAVTACSDLFSTSDGATAEAIDRLNVQKGDLILLEKDGVNKNNLSTYKIFHAKIGLGKSPTKQLQESLNSLEAGYLPKDVLFSKSGLIDFNISILVEKTAGDETIVNYQFLRETRGFEKEVNNFAKQGYEFIGGRRIGLTKMALMAKIDSQPKSYTFTDKEKYEKDFDKTISAGHLFHTLSEGDVDCDSGQGVNEKFIYVNNTSDKIPEYRFIKIDKTNNAANTGKTETDFETMLGQGFNPKALFSNNGFFLLMEKY